MGDANATAKNTMPSDEELYGSKIAELVERYGEVPPLWAYYPRIHPVDIHWRMGGGEDYKYLFSTWEKRRDWSIEDRIAYVQRWDPPFSWLEYVAWFLWPDDFDAHDVVEPSELHFARMEALGFGSRKDWERCFNIDPDKYPVADDTSSRWLDRK